MANVTLTAGIRQNLLSLQQTSSLIEQTQFNLSTGKRVNSALDDPIAFFKSQGLDYRASDLSARKDSIVQGLKTIQAADKGISGILKLVDSAQAKATAASELDTTRAYGTTAGSAAVDTGGWTSTHAVDFWADLGIDVESAEGLKDAKKLFGKFEMGMQSGTWEDIVLVYNDGDGGVISQTVKALEVAEYADKTGSFSTITVNELLGAMSDKVDGLIFEYNGDTNEVEIFASDKDIVISSISGSFTPAGLSFSAIACGAIKELDLAKQLAQLEGDYNSILDQIDMLANDSSYQGINLLNDDSPANKLTVFFNEDLSEDSVLKVQGVDVTALGLGLTEANWTETTEAGIETSINQSQSARGALRDASSGFSTSSAILDTRSDFTDEMVSTLKAGAGELVNADMNEESANMLALQTRQQLGTISLSIANQSEQSILRLF